MRAPAPIDKTATPRRGASNRRALEQALEAVLHAFGRDALGDLANTPLRAAEIWFEHILKGEGVDLAEALGRGRPCSSNAFVSMFHMGLHLVCPHHLTVAFGRAHLAYAPHGRIAGFGRIAKLVAASTARLVLQEEATQTISDTLVTSLGAEAAVVTVEAIHPCHNLLHPHAHAAQVITWAHSGNRKTARELKRLITAQLSRQP